MAKESKPNFKKKEPDLKNNREEFAEEQDVNQSKGKNSQQNDLDSKQAKRKNSQQNKEQNR